MLVSEVWKCCGRASEMAQRVKMFALKPDLSLIPEAHMVEGENWLPQVVLWPFMMILASPNVFWMLGLSFCRQRY